LWSNERQRLKGIFNGRDAVRALAEAKDAAVTILAHVMTPNPITTAPNSLTIDALRKMNNGGFRHLPVVENNTILGVVSRGDFKGIELDQLDEEEHLWECIR
jgi:CBS domain-containing protein